MATFDAIYGQPRRCRKRRVCSGHLRERHYIEVGELVVWSALPPGSEIENIGWWHHAYCSKCWPVECGVPSGDTP